MARGLDHIVHAVRDLDAAAGLYRRLGFQVGSRNRHPRAWGTQNHIVQLPGTFIELLTVADELLHQFKVTYARPDRLIPPEKVTVEAKSADLTARGMLSGPRDPRGSK